MAGSEDPRQPMGLSSCESLESLLAAQSDCHQPATLIPRPRTSDIRCCCGQDDCVFLRHNNVQLYGLERNVQTAAQMGQALLIRHETYMADAGRERRGMTEVIGRLEVAKRELETENTKTIEENRDLLNQLEELNNTVAETNEHIKSLTATLLSTQAELQRLTVLASRTAQLEAQLALLEEEQAQLQNTLITTKENELSAIQRWKRAERMLGDLQDEIERIEQEAREERERHIEVVGRLERRRVVEKELESAAGRLKGAAAAKTLGKNKGSSVVSHFVKDILQDNANLQMGIVELREMLLVSNEEVQTLREQLVMHQPVLVKSDGQRSATLRKELGVESSPVVPQEVHVHHHYHAPPHVQETSSKEKVAPLRRPKKKRNIITPTLFNPPSLQNLRSPTCLMSSSGPSTTATILSQTSVSIPPPTTPTFSPTRSSVQSIQTRSPFTPSSVPSSPPSVFDQGFGSSVIDSSRSTSPESSGPYSPAFSPSHFKRGSNASYHSFSVPAGAGAMAPVTVGLRPTWEEDDADAEYTDHDIAQDNDKILPENVEPSHEMANNVNMTSAEPNTNSDDNVLRPTLRRSTSHESILSVAALDLPTATSGRPSQVFFGKGAYSTPRTTLGIVSPSSALDASKPVLTAMTAIARPASRKGWGYDSSTYNRRLLESRQGPYSRNPSNGDSIPDGVGQPKDQTLGRRVGGWVWGRWGISPEYSSRGTRSVLEERPPGVNQPGSIRGMYPGSVLETNGRGKGKRKSVLVSEVDEELLREALGEWEA